MIIMGKLLLWIIALHCFCRIFICIDFNTGQRLSIGGLAFFQMLYQGYCMGHLLTWNLTRTEGSLIIFIIFKFWFHFHLLSLHNVFTYLIWAHPFLLVVCLAPSHLHSLLFRTISLLSICLQPIGTPQIFYIHVSASLQSFSLL